MFTKILKKFKISFVSRSTLLCLKPALLPVTAGTAIYNIWYFYLKKYHQHLNVFPGWPVKTLVWNRMAIVKRIVTFLILRVMWVGFLSQMYTQMSKRKLLLINQNTNWYLIGTLFCKIKCNILPIFQNNLMYFYYFASKSKEINNNINKTSKWRYRIMNDCRLVVKWVTLYYWNIVLCSLFKIS